MEFCWFEGENGIEDCRALRTEVFVQEQGVAPELEQDGMDGAAAHLCVYAGGQAIATARLFTDRWLVGRVATKKEMRGKGIGKAMMLEVLRYAFAHGAKHVEVHAQLHAVPFYASVGFVESGEAYMEAGMAHLPMCAQREA